MPCQTWESSTQQREGGHGDTKKEMVEVRVTIEK